MKEKFNYKLGLNKSNISRLVLINSIIEEYRKAGYKLTLRQLYYQLVSRDIIPNKQAEYAKLSVLLGKGRMAGVVDWDAIEDRLRTPHIPYSVESVKHAIESEAYIYRLDRMKNQDTYIEVWVEKDALSGVLRRITDKYHIRLMVNRGYSSISAMYDAYQRLSEPLELSHKVKILYLGDHDPSGLDMIRDIRDRLLEMLSNGKLADNIESEVDNFMHSSEGADKYQEVWDDEKYQIKVGKDVYFNWTRAYLDDFFEVIPIALTTKQVRYYNPPPNPAKFDDPRANDYIAEYGNTSWEVDALRPDILNSLLEDKIKENIDMDKYLQILEEEKEGKKQLLEIAEELE